MGSAARRRGPSWRTRPRGELARGEPPPDAAPPPSAPPAPPVEPPGTIHARDWVAIILALGAATAINLVTVAIMWDAIRVGAEVSENGTQIITGIMGGII